MEDDDEKRLIEIEEIEKILENIELIELKKEEEKVEEEEEEEEADEKDYQVKEMTIPKVSSWINGVDGTISKGVVVINNDCRVKNRCEFDVCPICFESLANNGNHRICCLPCGHIYGFSCINKWLRHPHTSKECPLCKKLCTIKNVKRLYASHLCVPAQTLHEASTTHFPFTKQGYKAFKLHVSQFRTDVLLVFEDVEKRRLHAYDRQFDIFGLLANLTGRMADAQGLVDSLGQRDDALGRRVNALGLRVKLLYPRVDAMELRVDTFVRLARALEQRVDALVRRDRAYRASILFFKQTYKKHMSLAQKNTKQQCPKKNVLEGQNTEQQLLPKSEFE